MPKLDEWLAQLFDPKNLDATVSAVVAAGDTDDAPLARADAARRKLADSDDRLTKYRAALDGGADPVVVAGWMSEVQGERLVAEAELATTERCGPRSPKDVRRLVASLGEMSQVLAEAAPEDKGAVYTELDVSVVYHPDQRLVVAEVGAQQNVSEDRLAT